MSMHASRNGKLVVALISFLEFPSAEFKNDLLVEEKCISSAITGESGLLLISQKWAPQRNLIQSAHFSRVAQHAELRRRRWGTKSGRARPCSRLASQGEWQRCD